MSTSRSDSQISQYRRRRSNTAQSVLRPVPPVTPVQVGESSKLKAWVHELREASSVIFNNSYWPGVSRGDLLRVTSQGSEDGFLFTVSAEDGNVKPQLQISIPKPIADAFELHNNEEVIVTKVDKDIFSAEYVELCFQDQYLGRNDMWRLGKNLVAKVQNIWVRGKTVSGAYLTSSTKAIYRSLSAKVTIYIQVCRELWQFAGDGERYNEKIVHSFLPSLFAKWREAGTNHTVTIVLISRVYYDETEIDYAAGPLRTDDSGRWYKDFFKVITDLEVIHDWKPTLVALKTSFFDFQRDILLTHHYHRSDGYLGKDEAVRLVGQISYAHDGPVLEALNLGLSPTETHYIDRSLSLTGVTFLLVTPGTGWFRVSKQLLRLTTTRMLDQGIGMDLMCLAKPPLHQTPIFCFQGVEPDSSLAPAYDPLWGPDNLVGSEIKTIWWEPFFISVSFWDQQLDLPFRRDRFVPRAKMHEIQMLGLLAHDVLSSIEVPYLPHGSIDILATPNPTDHDTLLTKADADKFDTDIFAPPISQLSERKSGSNRHSLPASISGSYTSISSVRSNMTVTDKRQSAGSTISRSSVIGLTRIPPIEESPKRIIAELPPEPGDSTLLGSAVFASNTRNSSPASVHSTLSALTKQTSRSGEPGGNKSMKPPTASLAAKLTPTWLKNPFRSTPSEPQTSPVMVAGVSNSPSSTPSSNPIKLPTAAKPTIAQQSPKPMAIQNSPSNSSRAHARTLTDDDAPLTFHGPSSRLGPKRSSPVDTPPREETGFSSKRRNTVLSTKSAIVHTPPTSSSPNIRTNPSKPDPSVSASSASLARRWQHMFPKPTYKHELKWKSLVTPGCLPLTVEHFPSARELEEDYDFFSYDFVVDPEEMKSFLVRPPHPDTGGAGYRRNSEDARRASALAVMRGMAAVRLAQGFQFVLSPSSQTFSSTSPEPEPSFRRTKSFLLEEELTPRARGAAEVLLSTTEPVYLSMSNEIHRLSYTGEAIQVGRYVRRMPPTKPFEYQCLIWPKLGVGYTELETKFESHGLEGYGWNRLDMLVAGYEQQFNESLRYWRTRFVVIPTLEPPQVTTGPTGESLNEEEARIVGIEKLAEQFSKLRSQNASDTDLTAPPIRFLPTTLTPAISVLDEALMEQLDQIHAAGPLRKKMKSEREIGEMQLPSIAKAMHEPDGVPIKHYQWHHMQYSNAFTGFDFVSWLVREFQDVSSRAQAVEVGVRLQEQGLFEHCRGQHSFLDGHYFYRLLGEFAVPTTPKARWFTYRRSTDEAPTPGKSVNSPRRHRKRLILSQSMVVNLDTAQKSDQAESVILHHDIIHNPATVFHFELQWIGTTARCIEDNLRTWNRAIERYGLKLVEAYVTQISDVREQNAFQSCFPIPLAVAPPTISDLAKRVTEGTHTTHYFEYALLQKFDFLVDIEAGRLYPEQIDVTYSYRRTPFKYSQFVHRTGVAFVQLLGGSEGFLFLTNRLMGPGRMGTGLAHKHKMMQPSSMAEKIRKRLQQFCSQPDALRTFYNEQISQLKAPPAIEDPPDLSI
ncbi:hypothetical protein DL96DRAFT_1814564 [Flagelloscypha sp. PMI_526]|nr:hypothetical protein DL96DRAFT_1814564 [Flagelloscypha sp. PMI_526]